MDWSENRKILLLALLAAIIMVAGNLGWLDPKKLQTLPGLASAWWQMYQMHVIVGLGLVIGIVITNLVRKNLQQRAYLRMIQQRVATGPTLQLLPRADWRPVDPANVKLWNRMADALPHDEHISFELSGNEDALAFGLHGSADGVKAAVTQIKAEWLGLHTKPVTDDPALLPEGWSLWWVEIAPTSFELPVTAASLDPLRSILIQMNSVMGDGRGLLQIIVRRNFGAVKTLGQKAFAARDEEIQSKGVRAIRQQEARQFEERASQTYLDVTLRAVGMADTAERAQGIAHALTRAVCASFEGKNPVQPVKQGATPQSIVERSFGKLSPWSGSDVAYLAHLAGSDLIQLAPRLRTAPARYLPADPEMRLSMEKHRTAFMRGSE